MKNKKLNFWVFAKIWNCRQMSRKWSIPMIKKIKISIFQYLSLGICLMSFWFTIQKIRGFHDFRHQKWFLGHISSRFTKLQILRPDSCSASKVMLDMLFSAKSETKRAKCHSTEALIRLLGKAGLKTLWEMMDSFCLCKFLGQSHVNPTPYKTVIQIFVASK